MRLKEESRQNVEFLHAGEISNEVFAKRMREIRLATAPRLREFACLLSAHHADST